ncbi:MAG: hypothetical protein EHM79_00320 [Geobacter sp.]|nr:MAG: hypothetical protein EHM79_00320 [Geobacter sp.]
MLHYRFGLCLQTINIPTITLAGGVAVNYDLDLRNKEFSGFMSLCLETTAKDDATGLDKVVVTVTPLVRNVADTAWLVPENTAALTLEDDVDMSEVTPTPLCGAWSVNKLFELSGDANKFMMAEGLRFTFDEFGGTNGKFVGKILLR